MLGGGLMVFSAFLLLKNRDALAGASGVTFIEVIPWVMLAIFLLGIGAALWFRVRDAARYEAVRRFVHEEA